VRYGIPLETAAAAGTHNPARALGLQNQCGFIAPGLRADLLLLDGQLNIRAVYIGGQKAR
jgi:N-acetylglucosamine-6-phosphate deacetylase